MSTSYFPILGAAVIAGALIILGYALWQQDSTSPNGETTPPSPSISPASSPSSLSPPQPEQNTRVVYDPGYGANIHVDVLTILASGKDVEQLIRPFGGKVLFAVSETDTYLVQFPITTLHELEEIIESLKRSGVSPYKVEAGVRPELAR